MLNKIAIFMAALLLFQTPAYSSPNKKLCGEDLIKTALAEGMEPLASGRIDDKLVLILLNSDYQWMIISVGTKPHNSDSCLIVSGTDFTINPDSSSNDSPKFLPESFKKI